MKYFIYSILLFLTVNTMKGQDIFSYAKADNIGELSQFKSEINTVNSEGYTPLILAVYNNSYHSAKWLLENGAKPDLQDYNGNTALMGAAFKGYYDMAELLLSRKAGVDTKNYNGATALIFATTFGRNDIVKLLLENNADKNIKDDRGNSALGHASIQNNETATQLLK